MAFVGMVVVNFNIVMVGSEAQYSLASQLVRSLEGRAAATFVVLAGVGLGLAAVRYEHGTTVWLSLRRAAFLLAIGLLNMLVFDADILHFYAFYFVFGAACLRFKTVRLVELTAAVIALSLVLLLVLDYDQGWNWDTLTYSGFWTTEGFIRNLFFNGWHPVLPWLAFLLYGMILSRLDLASRKVQLGLTAAGTAVMAVSELLSTWLSGVVATDPQLAVLFGTGPVPPVPLFVISGAAVASAVVGACLLLDGTFRHSKLLALLAQSGRQTLSLYIAHILIGMGLLEAFGLLQSTAAWESIVAALLFSALCIVYVRIWSRRFERGPFEMLMRRVAG